MKEKRSAEEKWAKVGDAKVGRDGEKKVRAVWECESCGGPGRERKKGHNRGDRKME